MFFAQMFHYPLSPLFTNKPRRRATSGSCCICTVMCVRLCDKLCVLSCVCKQCVRLDQDITDSAEIQVVKLRGKTKNKTKTFFSCYAQKSLLEQKTNMKMRIKSVFKMQDFMCLRVMTETPAEIYCKI